MCSASQPSSRAIVDAMRKREALLAEQGVAAVARAVRPDLAGLGEVDDVLVLGVARPRARRPGRRPAGTPTECRHGTNSPSPSTSRTAWPMRVMIRMFTATYGESVSCTPMWAMRDPSGPIENGTTYMVRPRIEPRNSPLQRRPHLGRVAPVVGGAGVDLALGADERAVLDPGDVAGVGQGEEAVRPRRGVERAERAAVDEQLAESLVLVLGAVAPLDPIGFAERDGLGRRRRAAAFVVGAVGAVDAVT